MLKIIHANNSKQWDKIVKSFKEYDVYYLNGYAKSFQVHGDGTPLLFYFEYGNTRAINVVIKKDISEEKHFIGKIEKNSYFHLSTPYGYGGWIIEGETGIKKLDEEYIEYCLENNIVSEFMRFHPFIKSYNLLKSFYDIKKLGNVINIDIKDDDLILKNMKSKDRNMITKAKKNGVIIFYDKAEDIIHKFINMYNETMERKNASAYYFFNKSFFNNLLAKLKNNYVIAYAEKDNIIVAMAIILFANNNLHYYLASSRKEYQIYAPSNLLIYNIACWGNENGYNRFLLGGGINGQEDGLYKFKKAFNKNGDESFYIGRKTFDKQRYEELLNIRKKHDSDFDMNNSYLTQYLAD